MTAKKTSWKRQLKNNPLVATWLNQWHERKYKHLKNHSPKEVFTEIYYQNIWKSTESRSGSGSEAKHSQAIRAALPKLLKQYQIQTLLDIPCGDFNWQKLLDWTDCQYIGGDIVKEMIEENQSKYANTTVQFMVLDMLKDDLPAADLILVRDAWVHFSFEHIFQSLHNLQKSPLKYLLATTFTAQQINLDITTGSWRAINLEKEPFCFPKPLALISEESTQSEGQYPDKSLALWQISSLKQISNPNL